MNHLNAFWLTVFGLLLFSHIAGAQETEPVQDHKHALSILLAHAHISQGIQNGKTKWLALPSWMLAYNYRISEQWTIGLHGDIIIEDFEVEANARSGGGEEILERSYPISLLAAGTYKPLRHLGIIGGGGFEYAREETFGLVRFGLEPLLPLSEKIELILNLSYDIKIDAYDNWNLGFGIAYGLGETDKNVP